MVEKETRDKVAQKSIGLKTLGKWGIKQLTKQLKKGSKEWGVPLETIVMQMRLHNDEPKVIIKEEHEGKKMFNLTESLGKMEQLGKLIFKKLLISITITAEDWETDIEDIRLDLRMVKDPENEGKYKPELLIQEESGKKRFMELVM